MAKPRTRSRRGRGPTPKRKVWEELQPGKVRPTPEVAAMIAAGDLDPDPEVWLNEQYAVIVQRREDGTVYVLRIRRVDGGDHIPWEILQRIKDEIAGEDAEAVELFPAVVRRRPLDDRWLWCVREGERWPLGIPAKDVCPECGEDDLVTFEPEDPDDQQDDRQECIGCGHVWMPAGGKSWQEQDEEVSDDGDDG